MQADLSGLLVASTVAAYKADKAEYVESWLTWAEEWRAGGARFFCAVQQRGRDERDRLDHLRARLRALEATTWLFSVDEGETSVGNSQRLTGICTGRNLAHEFAQRDRSIEAILFLDTDVCPQWDAPERLLEVQAPVVGGTIPTYGLDGPKADLAAGQDDAWWLRSADTGSLVPISVVDRPWPEGADVHEHWVSAGFLLVRRDAFRRLRWRWDLDAGSTDDPCFQADAVEVYRHQTLVRHDVIAHHQPGAIAPFDQRGHDLTVVR